MYNFFFLILFSRAIFVDFDTPEKRYINTFIPNYQSTVFTNKYIIQDDQPQCMNAIVVIWRRCVVLFRNYFDLLYATAEREEALKNTQ